MQKTIAMHLLDGKGTTYDVHAYPDSERDATAVARHLGVSPAQLFKTLVVVRARGKPFLAMVPADRQLDLKKMARAVGEKKLQMAGHAQAEKLTRLKVGGISPLALVNRGFDVVLDGTAQQFELIFVSAGEKGINLSVPVEALIAITAARVMDIASARED